MLSKLLSLFSGVKVSSKNTYIQVKYFDNEVSVFYKGQLLVPNTDYTVIQKQDSNYTLKIYKVLEKEHLDVRKSYTHYFGRGNKPSVVQRNWGFKKFKIV